MLDILLKSFASFQPLFCSRSVYTLLQSRLDAMLSRIPDVVFASLRGQKLLFFFQRKDKSVKSRHSLNGCLFTFKVVFFFSVLFYSYNHPLHPLTFRKPFPGRTNQTERSDVGLSPPLQVRDGLIFLSVHEINK